MKVKEFIPLALVIVVAFPSIIKYSFALGYFLGRVPVLAIVGFVKRKWVKVHAGILLFCLTLTILLLSGTFLFLKQEFPQQFIALLPECKVIEEFNLYIPPPGWDCCKTSNTNQTVCRFPPEFKVENLKICKTDEDCICYGGCGCINKAWAGKVVCTLLLQPCQTGEELCKCVEGKCESVKI